MDRRTLKHNYDAAKAALERAEKRIEYLTQSSHAARLERHVRDSADALAEERKKSAELTEMLRTITEEKAGPWFARLVGREREIDSLLSPKVCGCLDRNWVTQHHPRCAIAALRRLLIEGETQRQVDAAWSVALHEDPDRVRHMVADGQHGVMQITAARAIRSGDSISGTGFGLGTALTDSVPDGRGGHRVNVMLGGRLMTAGIEVFVDTDQSEHVHLTYPRGSTTSACGAADPYLIHIADRRAAVTCPQCLYLSPLNWDTGMPT